MLKEALRELVQSRELLLELSARDLRIRYKQTFLGVAWALLTPVLMMAVFTQVFTRAARIDTGDIPYPLFVYCGLLPWQFFSSSLKNAVESLTRNRLLVTKVYMPREVFPLSQVASAFADFLVASVVLVGMMAAYGVAPTWTIVFLPVLLAVQILFTVALALLLSMGNLFYRDVKYVFELVLLLWMFATSVVYPIRVEGWAGTLLALNPMTPIIDGYRRVLLEGAVPELAGFAYAAVLSTALCAFALRWFHESEYLFAENI